MGLAVWGNSGQVFCRLIIFSYFHWHFTVRWGQLQMWNFTHTEVKHMNMTWNGVNTLKCVGLFNPLPWHSRYQVSFFFFLLDWGLQLRPSSKFLCSWEHPWTSDPPTSASPCHVIRSPVTDLCSAGGWTRTSCMLGKQSTDWVTSHLNYLFSIDPSG